MAGNKRDPLDIVIADTFYFILIFGHTTHLYDTKKHRLVYSRKAHIYSLALHGLLVTALVCKAVREYAMGIIHAGITTHGLIITSCDVFGRLVYLLVFILQWTLREKVSTLFNEVIQIWQEDVARLQGGRQIRRQTVWLFALQALAIPLLIALQMFEESMLVDRRSFLALLTSTLEVALASAVYSIVFIFSSGLIFCLHLFRILNANLARVLAEIRCLRWRGHLEEELADLARTHSHLVSFVVRFKDAYQVDMSLIILVYFMVSVVMVFYMSYQFFTQPFVAMLLAIVSSTLSTDLILLHFLLVFYVCGEVLTASHEAGHLLKDLPAHGLGCLQLERRVEMVSFQFKIERLRLRICGLVDLGWSSYFVMVMAAILHLIILVQWDYSHF